MRTNRPDSHPRNLFGEGLLLKLDPTAPITEVIPWQDFTVHHTKGVWGRQKTDPFNDWITFSQTIREP